MQLNGQTKPKVLIVDDEPQVATALADMLEDRYRVVTQTSPQEGLDVLERDKEIAVVLSDQRMPGMTGDELFARAKEISLATRILITAYADITAVIDAVNQGKIYGYVTKPWQPSELMLTVDKAADHCHLNRKILHEQALLHQLMESSVDAIAIKDRSHRYIKVNQQKSKLLGVDDAGAVEGRTDSEFLPPERAYTQYRRQVAVLETGLPLRDCVDELVAKDGRASWYSSNLSPIHDMHGEVMGLVSIMRDVTETKRLDVMKDQFIATVSHELRTPLTAIRGSLDLLRADMVDEVSERTRGLIEIGLSNCRRLILLINDLLDTVSLEKGEMRFDRTEVEIREIIHAAAAAARRRAQSKDVAVSIDPDLAAVTIDADRDRLLQALLKLLDNAIEVTPPDRQIAVCARAVEGGKVRMSVTDQGSGVPHDFRLRIFKRFSQADSSNTREKGGVGLGLYIAKSIVEAHQGTIGYVNKPDGGAEFYFELPITAAGGA